MNIDCAAVRESLADVVERPDAAVRDEVALHLDRCEACRQHFDRGRVDFDLGVFERLSDAARRRMVEELAVMRSAHRRRRDAAVAAGIAAGVILAVFIGLRATGDDTSIVTVALVEDHIRYLNHPDGRQGPADAEEIVAHLEEHVDFPVRLPAIADSRLTGGRRCYLLDRRVALAFYDTPVGPVSYFTLDGEGLQMPGRICDGEIDLRCVAFKGYRVVTWTDAGLLRALVGPDSPSLDALAATAR